MRAHPYLRLQSLGFLSQRVQFAAHVVNWVSAIAVGHQNAWCVARLVHHWVNAAPTGQSAFEKCWLREVQYQNTRDRRLPAAQRQLDNIWHYSCWRVWRPFDPLQRFHRHPYSQSPPKAPSEPHFSWSRRDAAEPCIDIYGSGMLRIDR